MIDALVLAGSLNNGPLQGVSTEKYEALIPIGPHSMLEYVLNALQNSSCVDRVLVAGPPEIQEVLPKDTIWMRSADTMMENIQQGCALMEGSFLLVTSDIPLLTPQAVQGFLDLCGENQEDLYFPLVPRPLVEKNFPGSKRTYVHFKEGVFTGGNLFLVNPRVVPACLRIGQELIALRKKPWALARRVGYSLLLKLILQRLALQEVQEKASGLLGIRGKAVICPFPEVGVDVDKPADLEMICRVLGYDNLQPTSGRALPRTVGAENH